MTRARSTIATLDANSCRRGSMPDYAVVIPCYNAAAHLDDAIASVLTQSRPASSIFVVDDASTDQSWAIADSYRTRGYPVQCIRLARNGGPATARNTALARTAEPFVAFLDADDRWTERHCESLLSLLIQHSHVDLAFSLVSEGGKSRAPAPLPVPSGTPVHMLEYLLDDSFVPQSGVMARREGILAAGGYRDGMRYSEDYDLWMRMARQGAFITSGAPTCIRTSHTGQASRNALRMYRGAWETRVRYWESPGSKDCGVPFPRFREICARAYNRDLAEAWRSRSFSLLRGVLDLAVLVPDGRAIRRRWLWRAIAFWPFWRLAALVWDSLPKRWRHILGAARRSAIPPVALSAGADVRQSHSAKVGHD